jgi:hypothetical protein
LNPILHESEKEKTDAVEMNQRDCPPWTPVQRILRIKAAQANAICNAIIPSITTAVITEVKSFIGRRDDTRLVSLLSMHAKKMIRQGRKPMAKPENIHDRA